jgi:hypothetical protein
MIAKCSCQHCGQYLEFEGEHDGEYIQCPECQRSTKLQAQSPVIKKTALGLLRFSVEFVAVSIIIGISALFGCVIPTTAAIIASIFYLFPTWLAKRRRKRNLAALATLNIFGLIAFLYLLIALVFSVLAFSFSDMGKGETAFFRNVFGLFYPHTREGLEIAFWIAGILSLLLWCVSLIWALLHDSAPNRFEPVSPVK